MNIKEAKQEIADAVEAYLQKDATGEYEIPIEKQRPILLMGPPGIGKTAIMEQVAKECGINLVSYTITHHTRQSAIGLPFISKEEFGGKEYSVTEYTMSEIIAAIYQQIRRSGIKEGILFLDEINCVSETLSPTMLQFLQYKTFGSHRVPEGFVIVTAGNPPQYNKSVRDLDVVTLDRVRRIDVEADFDCWKEYAYDAGVDGSILAYLEIKRENFYSVKNDSKGRKFVTARGWEDLSRIIKVHRKLRCPVTEGLVSQYLQNKEIARDFSDYYELYHKYRQVYRIPDILEGKLPQESDQLKTAPFDEKLSLISLLIDQLNQEFRSYGENLEIQREIFTAIKRIREKINDNLHFSGTLPEAIDKEKEHLQKELLQAREAELLTQQQIRVKKLAIAYLEDLQQKVILEDGDFSYVKNCFSDREQERQKQVQETGEHLTNSFAFLEKVFGEGQEMVIFLTELSAGSLSLRYIRECGNEAYYRYNKLLLLEERKEELTRSIQESLAL